MTSDIHHDNPDIVRLVTEGIQERKGRNIVHIDLSGIESAAASDFKIGRASCRERV